MMAGDHFSLKWSNFQSTIISAFESLHSTQDLADVTLTCEGLNLKAHKVILSACSPYFRTVFKENPCSHPIVILKDVLYTDLLSVLKFMYQGEVVLNKEHLNSFLQTAEILQVSGLIGPNEPVPTDKSARLIPNNNNNKSTDNAIVKALVARTNARMCRQPTPSQLNTHTGSSSDSGLGSQLQQQRSSAHAHDVGPLKKPKLTHRPASSIADTINNNNSTNSQRTRSHSLHTPPLKPAPIEVEVDSVRSLTTTVRNSSLDNDLKIEDECADGRLSGGSSVGIRTGVTGDCGARKPGAQVSLLEAALDTNTSILERSLLKASNKPAPRNVPKLLKCLPLPPRKPPDVGSGAVTAQCSVENSSSNSSSSLSTRSSNDSSTSPARSTPAGGATPGSTGSGAPADCVSAAGAPAHIKTELFDDELDDDDENQQMVEIEVTPDQALEAGEEYYSITGLPVRPLSTPPSGSSSGNNAATGVDGLPLGTHSSHAQSAASAAAVPTTQHNSQCGNCPHCGKTYSNQSALKYHVRLLHSDLLNLYCCHLCPQMFDYREGYKKHMIEVHSFRN